MKTTKIKALSVVLGTILVLGLPPALLVTQLSRGDLGVEAPKDPLRALIAQDSSLERFYLDWQKDYVASGGDRNVRITVAWTEGLSTESSDAHGLVGLDLIDGRVRAELWGLDGLPADLWLVEDGEGPGMSVRPQIGDRMVRVGRLRPDGSSARLTASLGPDFFRGFWLDLVVVSRAGETPAESSVLLGTRGYFERVYTRTRMSMEKAQEKARPSLLQPASLLSFLFSPRLAEADSTQILISHGLISQNVGDGGELFFRGKFSGNTRTCGTCHRVELNQGLDAPFIATLPATDPLFVAEFTSGGVPGLERPKLMKSHALILENVDGFENPTVKLTMRGVPHSLSLFTSIKKPADTRAPVERTGWSGDGAPQTGALRLFPVGAVRQHFTKRLNRVEGVDFVLPTSTQLDKMAAFMLASGRLNDLSLANVTLTNAGAQAGKVRFVAQDARCNGCHANAGANVANGTNVNFDTGVETVVHPAQSIEKFPLDGGFGAALTPNFDCNKDGTLDCFGDGTFNTPPLVEAADTPPFFHNNVSATLEGAITFYTTNAFKNSPAGGGAAIPINATDIANIGKFLRVINAAFNVSISIQRNTAAASLENSSGTSPCAVADDGSGESTAAEGTDCGGDPPEVPGKRETVNTLLLLSNVEATDAKDVLQAKALHADAVSLLNSAISKNNQAINEEASQVRLLLIESALNDLNAAKAKFGTGLNFTLGGGNLMF